MALAGFIGGALALAGGITCLWLDGKESTNTAVSFVPTTQGGVFVLKGRF